MDKTISISLGGYSFVIDDAAYLKLKNYLDQVRISLGNMEGTDEIISDIEVRIAELFRERLGSKEVVNGGDVDYIIGIMGKPEQYVDEDAGADTSGFSAGRTSEIPKKKLYRDPNDKILGGVASGIAHYMGIESWITRILWVVLFFSDAFISLTSITVITYIVLWIVLPKAETASQRYEMMGQAGDLETIKKNADLSSGVKKTSNGIGEVVSIIGKIFLIFFGIMFIIIGLSLVFGAIMIIIAAAGRLPMTFGGFIFDQPWQDWAAKAMLFILVAIPAIMVTLLGAKLISSRVTINRAVLFGGISLWILSLIGASVLGASVFRDFTHKVEISDKKSYTVENDTLSITFKNYENMNQKSVRGIFDFKSDGLVEYEGKLLMEVPEKIEIRPSKDNQVSVETIYRSKGSSMDNAQKNAEMTQYEFIMNSKGELQFNDYLTLPKGSKFRNQNVSLVVYVPKGKTIHFENVNNIIFNEPGTNSKIYRRGKNKFYRFAENHFECLNCSEEEGKSTVKDSGKSTVSISPGGITIQDGDDEIIINSSKIKVSDDTDSIDIDISGD